MVGQVTFGWETGDMVVGADDLGAWLVAVLAEAGRKKLTALVLGDELDRALRQAATAAVQAAAQELRPGDDERAGQVAMVVGEVFAAAMPGAGLAGQGTLLERLQAGVAGQLAVLDDPELTDAGVSSAAVLGIPGAVLAEQLTGHLLAQILSRGARGGPLFPLAAQINDDRTHLQGQRLEGLVRRVGAEILDVLAPLDSARAVAAPVALAQLPPGIRGAGAVYLEQVRRIAPPDPPGLLGRDAELDELAAFCLREDGESYAWWQAGPWAGKSALLSSFVLRPPPQVAEQVRLVSFFITARLAAQDTRQAFTRVVLDQLAALTGDELRTALPEETREGYFLDLLGQAAAACAKAGRRLVLVVDGLDEDRGVIAGPEAHSIAALLPAEPVARMRVIVAGRPDPPVPDDVPGWHPLRNRSVVRHLDGSPYARDVQQLSQRELRRLLHGTEAEQNLLGLVTAARGGLSAADLEELTGNPVGEVREILGSVAGRTFTRRAAQAGQAGPEVYLLGHEELQAAAGSYLGRRLDTYRDQLHAWAEGYRDQGWPASTPEYLLSGYFRLLAATGDLGRVIACGLDAGRHDRMLDVTGGDSAALEEARTGLDFLAAAQDPDLGSALALACHRDLLARRNTRIPASLPAVWVTLGHATRAQALATSLTEPGPRARTLTLAAEALAETGQREEAVRVTGQAEAAAGAITDPYERAEALARVAEILTGTGQSEEAARVARQAEAAARAITSPEWRARTMALTAGTLAGAGQYKEARAIARAIADPYGRADALGRVAEMLARAGQREEAVQVAGQAEVAARDITEPYGPAVPLYRVAEALAVAGQYQEAEAVARSMTGPGLHAQALVRVARALAREGQPQEAARAARQAESVARSIASPDWRAQTLAQSVAALAAAGQREEAAQLAMQVQAAVRAITDPHRQAWTMAEIVETLAGAGQYQQAGAAAQAITQPGKRAQPLAQIAGALAGAGRHEEAARVAAQAEAAAGAITDSHEQAEALCQVAKTLAGAGQREEAARVAAQAEAAARAITVPHEQASALARVAGALADAGQRGEAAWVAGQAEAAARAITDGGSQAAALAWLAETLIKAVQRAEAVRVAGQAEAAARSITDPHEQVEALCRVAEILAEAGQPEEAAEVARKARAAARDITDADGLSLAAVAEALAAAGQDQQARIVARAITDPFGHALALSRIAKRLARAGQREKAARLARKGQAAAGDIADPDEKAYALSQVAETLAEARQPEEAARVAGQAETAARAITAPLWQPLTLYQVAETLAETGHHQQAEVIARDMTHPYDQADALARVAETLVEADQREEAARVAGQAEAAARATTNPDEQAAALARVARARAEAGDACSARRAVAAACAAGTWTATVQAVLALDPAGWAPLARILDSAWHTQLTRTPEAGPTPPQDASATTSAPAGKGEEAAAGHRRPSDKNSLNDKPCYRHSDS